MLEPSFYDGVRRSDRLGRLLVCLARVVVLCVLFNGIDSGAYTGKPLTLVLERKADEIPSAIVLEATLQNVSKHEIIIDVSDPLFDYTLVVTDPRRVPVPFSERGEEIFSKDRVRTTRSIEVHLAPKETYHETLVIGDVYQFTAPGRYLVTVTRQFWTPEGRGSVLRRV